MPVPQDLAQLADATTRLLATVDGLSDADVRAPSALPKWSRGHLITHLARNADGIRNMLLSARTGAEAFMYPSGALRNADIEAGSTRPEPLIRLDLQAAAGRFAIDAGSMTGPQWEGDTPMGSGDAPVKSRIPASGLAWLRLREVEVHHVDLDAGYSFADTPADLLERLLDHTVGLIGGTGKLDCTIEATTTGRTLRIGSGGPTVTGPDHAILTWLLRRGVAPDLAVSGDAVRGDAGLPEVPSLG